MSNSQTKTSLNRSFVLGKLFSLFGLIPIGAYVIWHLFNNARSIYGAESFNEYLAGARAWPLIVPILILVIWIPIAFHGIYGLFLMKTSRPNLVRFPFFENLKYVLQRLSGIGLLLFIPAHIYKTRFDPAEHGVVLDFAHMVEGMHEDITLPVYLLGVLGVAFHLANGVWQASIGWGLTTSEAGMKRMQALSMVLFIVLLGLGYASIWGFYRAG